MNNQRNQTGIISDVRYVKIGDGKICEVKVEVDGRDTNWLPKLGIVGKSFKMHIPPRVGDQVVVHNENGKNQDGYITDNIAFEKVPNHEKISEDNIVMWSEDGTTYIHDIKDEIITLTTPCDISITAPTIDFKGIVTVNGVPIP
jgi:phage baseplate assembly protein gpV